MKFLLANNPKYILENVKANNLEVYNISFDVHPSLMQKTVEDFLAQVESGFDGGIYTTNNLRAMIHIPDDCFLWVDKIKNEEGLEEIVVTPFWEVFSAFKGIILPDVYDMACYGKLPRDKNAEKEGKVKYIVPFEREDV